VLEGAAQAIEPPDHHGVTGPELVEEAVELGPAVQLARNLVGENLDAACGLEASSWRVASWSEVETRA